MMFMKLLVWIAYIITLFIATYWVLLYLGTDQEHRKPIKKKTPKKWPELAVIVPAYNEEKTLKKTLESLLQLIYPQDKLTIYVMDDGSTDNTQIIGKTYAENHKNIIYTRQKNQGKAVALNNALKKIRAPFFACLDADSSIDQKAAKEMIRSFTADKNLEICTPVMRVAQPKNWIQKFQRVEYLAAMLLVRMLSTIESNYVAPGPFSMYRTQTVKDFGGFDINSMVEDQEMAYRIQYHHKKLRQVEKAYVDTVAPHTFKGLRQQRNRWMKGTLLTIIKYRKLLFNKEYGDFGSFTMPITLFSFLLAIIAIGAFIFYAIRPVFNIIQDLFLVGFDIVPFIDNFHLHFNILDPSYPSLLMIWLLLGISIFLLWMSGRFYADPVRKYGSVYIIPYFFVYFLLLAFVSVQVLVEVALGKKQKW